MVNTSTLERMKIQRERNIVQLKNDAEQLRQNEAQMIRNRRFLHFFGWVPGAGSVVREADDRLREVDQRLRDADSRLRRADESIDQWVGINPHR
jgi:hypothetical protein